MTPKPLTGDHRSILGPALLRLEDRVFLDAAGLPMIGGDSPGHAATGDGHAGADVAATGHPPPDPGDASASHGCTPADGMDRVLVVSSEVDQAAVLADAVQDGVQAMVFDAQAVDLEQLLERIRAGLADGHADSIALATHGLAGGGFELVSGQAVNLETLSQPEMRAFWRGLAELLRPGGRIDLLACDAAAGAHGHVLVTALENLTGADFAASVDATGNPHVGGDWILETDGVDVAGEYFDHGHLSHFSEVLAPAVADTNPTHNVVGSKGAVVVDSGITVNDGGGGPLMGALVRFRSGFTPGEDQLSLDAGAASAAGLSWSYDSATGQLLLQGAASAADYQSVLRTVTYENTSTTPATTPRDILFVIGDDFGSYKYLPSSGHYYMLVDPPGPPTVTWATADADANTRTVMGLTGYLATVTSGAENTLAAGLVPAFPLNKLAWLGGADDVDNVWYWVRGPEAGTHFWQGDGMGGPVGGQYSNWLTPAFPSVAGSGHAAVLSSSWWNDAAAVTAHDYYIVEFGGLPTDAEDQLVAHVAINVAAPNHAPVLDNSGLMSVAVEEDSTGHFGSTIASIIASAGGNRITDYNGDPEGIAIVGTDTSHGRWEYSTDSGSTWHDVGPVANHNALLLRETDRVRFVPEPDWNGTLDAALTFRAWDQSAGSPGSHADTQAGGGDSAFSTDTETVSLVVHAVNDAPVLDHSLHLHLNDINEDDALNGGTTVASVLGSAGVDPISDVDTGALHGLAIVGVDATHGMWQYSLDGGQTWLNITAVNVNHALLLRGEDLLRFVPEADFNGDAGPGLTFHAWDQSAGTAGGYGNVAVAGGTTPFSAASASAGLHVHALNDAPVVAHLLIDQNADDDGPFNYQFGADSFSDVDAGDTLTFHATLADGSPLPAWLAFDPVTRTFSGLPGRTDVGLLTIKVTATDSHGATAADEFTLDVSHLNHPPVVAQPLADQAATAGNPFEYRFGADAFTDVDAGDTLTFSAALANGSPLPAWLAFDPVTRTFSGQPGLAHVGTLSVRVTADDGHGGVVTDVFVLSVSGSSTQGGAGTPASSEPPPHIPRGGDHGGTSAAGTDAGPPPALPPAASEAHTTTLGLGTTLTDSGPLTDDMVGTEPLADAMAGAADAAGGTPGEVIADGQAGAGVSPAQAMAGVVGGSTAGGQHTGTVYHREREEEFLFSGDELVTQINSALFTGDLLNDETQPPEFREAWNTILAAYVESGTELTAYLQSAFRTITESACLHRAVEQAIQVLTAELEAAASEGLHVDANPLLTEATGARDDVRAATSELEHVIQAAAEAGRRDSFDQVLDDVIRGALQRLMAANEQLFIQTQALTAVLASVRDARAGGQSPDADQMAAVVAAARQAAQEEFAEMRKSWDRVAQDVFAAFVRQLVARHTGGDPQPTP